MKRNVIAWKAYTVIPDILIWWPRTDKRWGWYEDCIGRCFGIGTLTYYPRGYDDGSSK